MSGETECKSACLPPSTTGRRHGRVKSPISRLSSASSPASIIAVAPGGAAGRHTSLPGAGGAATGRGDGKRAVLTVRRRRSGRVDVPSQLTAGDSGVVVLDWWRPMTWPVDDRTAIRLSRSTFAVCRQPHNYYYYYTRLTALCPALPRWAGTRKVKPI